MIDSYTRAEWGKVALITIDTQYDFTMDNDAFAVKGTFDVVPNIRQVLQSFRDTGKPIFHVIRLYKRDGSNADLCRRGLIAEMGKELVIVGSRGAELVDELKSPFNEKLDARSLLKGKLQKIAKNEWIIYKPRWGAFYGTSLDKHLRDRKISTVVICGCNFPNCPRTSVYEASERDFRVVLITDATSNVYDRGLTELQKIGVELVSTKKCISAINRMVKTSD